MKRRNQKGFTLVETLTAVFILTFVLLAVGSLVYSIMRSTTSSKEMTVATTLMQDKMEGLRNTSLSSLNSGNDTVRMGNIDYLRQWVVAASGNIRTITVDINWNSRGSHVVTMTTLRGD
jgi:prepilin-type N-terminal cleavage/methylation domain-containing protein